MSVSSSRRVLLPVSSLGVPSIDGLRPTTSCAGDELAHRNESRTSASAHRRGLTSSPHAESSEETKGSMTVRDRRLAYIARASVRTWTCSSSTHAGVRGMSSSRAAMGTLAARRRCVDPAFRRKRLCREETTGRRSADKWNMIRPMIRLLVSLSYKPSIASKNSARDSGNSAAPATKKVQKAQRRGKRCPLEKPTRSPVVQHTQDRHIRQKLAANPSNTFARASSNDPAARRDMFTSTRRPTPIIHDRPPPRLAPGRWPSSARASPASARPT